jgi:glycosyltransferase involved in cell wall biosynthesis
MTASAPIRVLHVVYTLNRGGIETWLAQLARHLDRTAFQMDFLVHTPDPCDCEPEVIAHGCRVFRCPPPTNPFRHAWAALKVLRQYAPGGIVHSHVTFSGYLLRLARWAGVRVRIAHSHSDVDGYRGKAHFLQRPFLALTNPLIRWDATAGLAASRPAAAALFGQRWESDTRWRVFHCGIDLSPFELPAESAQTVRAELGIPPGALVVGHVGRLVWEKNHDFLLDVAAELVRREARAHLLLVGDGPLRQAVQEKMARLGLDGRVTFALLRSDVPRLLRGAVDVFTLPSHSEGLPLAGLEAQAAGLPCVWSDAITAEVDVVSELVRRLPLAAGAPAWADAILESATRRLSPGEALAAVRESTFNIVTGVRALERFYRQQQAACGNEKAETVEQGS